MLKLIGWFIKASIFAAVVLVLGNLVRWDGKSVSDRVKTQVSHAEKAPIVNYVTSWGSARRKPTSIRAANPVNAPSAQNAERAIREQAAAPVTAPVAANDEAPASDSGEMLSSERQKLRALIRELNSPRISN